MPNHVPLPSHSAPISVRQLNSHARLEPEARALATQSLPKADQDGPSKSESEAIELIEGRITTRNDAREAEAHNIEGLINDLPNPDTDCNLFHLDAHVTNEIMKVFHTHAPAIRNTVAHERQAQAALNAFRNANGLGDRTAFYPLSRINHFAMVGLVMMIEATANMFMFIDAVTTGLLGALTTALAIAAANVALAIFAGLVPLRFLNIKDQEDGSSRRSLVIRLWAIPALSVSACLIMFLNLFAAHFRELAVAKHAFDEKLVLARLIAEPFNLSLQSYILLILGLLFALYALHKGYTASDPYPGYEAPARRQAEAADDKNYLTASIHGGIDAVREAKIVNVTDYPLATGGQLAAIRKRLTALAISNGRDQSLDEQDERAAKTAIANWRALNRQIRTDGITPGYFKTPLDFKHLRQPLDTAAIVDIKLELAAGTSWADIMDRRKVSRDTVYHAHLANLIETATAAHEKHTKRLFELVTRLLKRVEDAKDKTEQIMAAIEQSHVDDDALPDLAELRALIDPGAAKNDAAPRASPDPANA